MDKYWHMGEQEKIPNSEQWIKASYRQSKRALTEGKLQWDWKVKERDTTKSMFQEKNSIIGVQIELKEGTPVN